MIFLRFQKTEKTPLWGLESICIGKNDRYWPLIKVQKPNTERHSICIGNLTIDVKKFHMEKKLSKSTPPSCGLDKDQRKDQNDFPWFGNGPSQTWYKLWKSKKCEKMSNALKGQLTNLTVKFILSYKSEPKLQKFS